MIYRAFAVAFAALALLLSACSSDDTTSTPTPLGNGGSSASAAATAKPTTSASTTKPSVTSASTAPAGGTVGVAPVACSLLTPEQVSAIVGHQVGPGATPTDGHECDYRWDDPASPLHFVEGNITVNEDLHLFQGVADGRNDVLAATITHITGVGDDAAQVAPDLGVPFLWFRKGNLAFETSMQDSSGATDVPTQEGVDKQLALAALARIP